jgi:integrase
VNQGLISTGAGVNFNHFIEDTYIDSYLINRASTVQKVYRGALRKYLQPALGERSLGDLTPLALQKFFAAMRKQGVSYPVMVKTRDALSHVIRSAIRARLISENPLNDVEMPPDKRGKVRKVVISPKEFQALLELIAEPYATMVYTALWTGLRVSELAALRWRNVEATRLSVEQRYCRGDEAAPKTSASAATIAIESHVVSRLYAMKDVTVNVRAGLAMRRCKAVKSDGPDDLVFQSIYKGSYMNDGNVLRRHIKPAAEKLGLHGINWLCLRRSCVTWQLEAGADPKSVQGQVRHARSSTTMEIYAQLVPEGQRRAAEKMTQYFLENAGPLLVQ